MVSFLFNPNTAFAGTKELGLGLVIGMALARAAFTMERRTHA